jgi:hypothetical protein
MSSVPLYAGALLRDDDVRITANDHTPFLTLFYTHPFPSFAPAVWMLKSGTRKLHLMSSDTGIEDFAS